MIDTAQKASGFVGEVIMVLEADKSDLVSLLSKMGLRSCREMYFQDNRIVHESTGPSQGVWMVIRSSLYGKTITQKVRIG